MMTELLIIQHNGQYYTVYYDIDGKVVIREKQLTHDDIVNRIKKAESATIRIFGDTIHTRNEWDYIS